MPQILHNNSGGEIVILTRVASEPAQNNDYGPLPMKFGHSYPKKSWRVDRGLLLNFRVSRKTNKH